MTAKKDQIFFVNLTPDERAELLGEDYPDDEPARCGKCKSWANQAECYFCAYLESEE